MDEIKLLQKKLLREKEARKQAEEILEQKALELFKANEDLKKLNDSLEEQIQNRTLELQESEKKYRSVIEQASDIIYSVDDEGYFTFINSLGLEAFGYENDIILGSRYIDYVVDEYKEIVFHYYTNLKEKNIKQDYYEFPIISKSGKIHWIGQNVNRIEASNGQFYYNAVARDITERIKAQKSLEKARTALIKSDIKYRSILENMDLGLMEVDLNGTITKVYDRFIEMTGYSSDELIGKNALDTLIVKGYEDVLKQQDQNRLKGESGVYEVKIRRKSGEEIWVLISGAPFYDENEKIQGSLGIHYDITQRKNLEQDLEVAKEKAVKAQQAEQQFLANMSHEIRTPLNAIIGMSHLLKDSQLDVEQSEQVEILMSSASLLKSLVSDILDISKINSGQIDKNNTSFYLEPAIEEIIKPWSIDKLNDRFEYEIGFPKDLMVHTDKQWLSQIITNLLSNAFKFTKKGQIKLTTKLIADSVDSIEIYFEVHDTGIGMSSEEMDLIFKPFKQANRKVQSQFGGTGLGLSISNKLVDLLGGKLLVESKIGQGSKFYFTIPLEKSQSAKDYQTKQLDFSMMRKTNVLIVEDNIMNQKYISALMNKWEINYDIANNGVEAIEKFNSRPYHIIFMDLSMPLKDGYETTQEIRSFPNGKEIPIIALTASTFKSKKQLALEAGMTDFLGKPFSPTELSNILIRYAPIINKTEKSEKTFIFHPQLDQNALVELYQNDLQYANEMFLTFNAIIENELDVLHKATNDQELGKIKKQIHKMKPTFKMVGLTSIFNTFEEIEREVLDSDFALVKNKIDDAKKVIQQSIPIIRSVMSKLNDELNEY